MTSGAGRIGLIQTIKPKHVAKEFAIDSFGRLLKRAVAHITEGDYWSKAAQSALELADILRKASERHDCCTILDVLRGDDERMVKIIPEAALARLLELKPGHPNLSGIHNTESGPIAARLKRSLKPSGWLLMDADNPPGMPPELAVLSLSERLERLEKIVPGIAAAERVVMRSSSARVRQGNLPPGGPSHAYIRVNDASKIETLRIWMDVETQRQGLTFPSPRYSRETGEVIGHGSRTLVDLCVLVSGRLVFVAKPILTRSAVKAHYVVHDADVRIENEGGGVLDLSGIELPSQRALDELERITGSRITLTRQPGIDGQASLVLYEQGMLTLETMVEVRSQLRPCGAWLGELEVGRRLRCETPFRASQSEAALLRRTRSETFGDGCILHDVGTSTTHRLAPSPARAIGNLDAPADRPVALGVEETLVRATMGPDGAGLVWDWGWDFVGHLAVPKQHHLKIVHRIDDGPGVARLMKRLQRAGKALSFLVFAAGAQSS